MATSTFGGPIATPSFDQLAKQGLRYNEFQVNAICSPTRAALLLCYKLFPILSLQAPILAEYDRARFY